MSELRKSNLWSSESQWGEDLKGSGGRRKNMIEIYFIQNIFKLNFKKSIKLYRWGNTLQIGRSSVCHSSAERQAPYPEREAQNRAICPQPAAVCSHPTDAATESEIASVCGTQEWPLTPWVWASFLLLPTNVWRETEPCGSLSLWREQS